MEAKEYARIADLLMQIRSKYSIRTIRKPSLKKEILEHLDRLLELNDLAGELNAIGWL